MTDPTPQSPPPGWYDNEGVTRWWDGTAWTEHTAPAAAQVTGPAAPIAAQSTEASTWTGTVTDEQRKQALAAAVARQVQRGYRVEATSDFQAVLVKGRRPNNTFHLLMSVITLGMWFVFVWMWLLLFARERRHTLTADAYGNVSTA